LPAALRDSLLGGMFSEDPAVQVAAAGRFVAFENIGPALTANIPDDILALARTMETYAYPGLPPRPHRAAGEREDGAARRGRER